MKPALPNLKNLEYRIWNLVKKRILTSNYQILNSKFRLPNSKFQIPNSKNLQRGFIKLTKSTIISYLIVATALSGSGLFFLFNPFGTKTTEAAWFNDNWAYRKELTLTIDSQSSARTNVYSLLTIDTNLTSAKLQSLCQDLRFTDITGVIIPYYIVDTSSCNTNGTNKIWLKIPTVPASTTSQIIYMYYGNPSASAGSDISQLPLVNGLNGYWKLNESSGNAADNSVNANTLTNNNTTAYAAGNFANAADFVAASSQTLSITDASQTGLDNLNTYTISTWINPDVVTSRMIINKDSANGSCSFYLFMLNPGTVRFHTCPSGNYVYSSLDSASNLIVASTWQLITLTYDGATIRLYRNGVEQTSGSFPASVTGRNIGNAGADFKLGGGETNSGGISYFDGLMDDTRIYNRALTDTEVASLYNTPSGEIYLSASSTEQTPSAGSEAKGPAPTLYWRFDDGQGTNAEDSTTNALDGTLNNTPTWQTEDQCIAGKCLYFDGANNENVSRADDAKLDFIAADNFTVSAWVKRSGTSSAINYILSKADTTTGGYKLYMDASGDLCFGVDDDATWTPDDEACTSAVDFDDDQWHFVTGVKSGTTSITLYVDGQQRAQDATIAATGTLANGNTLYVGVDRDGLSNEWLGFIDEVKITRDNSARTAAQVLADYNARSNPEGVASVLGTNTQNMPDALSNGLVGYWKLDETSGNATDSSGNGTTLTDGSTTTYAAGKFANGADLELSSTDYLYAADSAILSQTGSLTLSAWIKPETVSAGTYNILGKWDGSNESYRLMQNADEIRMEIDSNGNYQETSSSNLAAGTWYHVAGVYDAGNAVVRIYVNGALAASSTTGTIPSLIGDDGGRLQIGAEDTTGGAANYYDGIVDEARIYNRILSSAEVSQLYNWAPGPIGYWKLDESSWTNDCSTDTVFDSSGYGTNGDACPNSTGPTGGAIGKYDKAGNFDGSNDYVSLGTGLNAMGGLTISTWIKIDTLNGSFRDIFTKMDNTGCGSPYEFGIGTNNLFYFAWTDDGCGYESYDLVDFTPVINTWYHVAVTRNSALDTVYFYINGVKYTGSLTSPEHGMTGVTNSPVSIGRAGAYTDQYFDGIIDNVKLYNYEQTSAQVIADMNAGHPAPGSPVSSAVAHWKLDEGYGTTANDYSSNGNSLTLSTATSAWTNNGKFGKAWSGGGARYMSKSTDSDLEFGAADSFAISLWYRSDAAANPGSTEYLVSDTTANADVGIGIYANTSGNLCFGIDDDTTWGPDIASCTTTDVYDGNWHHLTAVRDVTADTTSIYIDAQVKDSDSDTTTGTLDGNNTFFIGDIDTADDGEEFTGSLDEIKVYRSALTADQIKLDMNRSASEVLGALSDSSTAGNDNASTRTAQSAASQYCIPGDSSTCTGPVLKWNLDEASGTTIQDSSTNGRTGTLNTPASVTWTNGKINKAVLFDGATSADHNLSTNSTYTPPTTVTIEAWVYSKGNGGNGVGQIFKTFNGTGTGYFLVQNSTTCYRFRSVHATAGQWYTPTGTVTANAWQHIAVTYDAGSVANIPSIYINGQLQSLDGTCSANITPVGSWTSSAGTWTVGGDSTATNTYNGIIDQVVVFDYQRTAAQIAWDYNKGAPIAHWKMDECQGTTINDMSGNSLTGTLTIGGFGTNSAAGTCNTSSTFWGDGVTGKRNYSGYFDGSGDYINVSDNAALNPTDGVSASVWINPADTTNTSILQKYIAATGGSSYDGQYQLYTDGSSIVKWVVRGTSVSYEAANPTAISTGSWIHVVGTYDRTAAKLYINGREVSSTAGTEAIYSAATNILSIGRPAGDNTSYFNGLLDDARVYNYGLTAAQVKTLYNQGAVNYSPSTGAP